jgi:hypothetical protein
MSQKYLMLFSKCAIQNDLYFTPSAMEMDIQIVAHHLCKMWIFCEPKSNVMKYMTFCSGINWDCLASSKKI